MYATIYVLEENIEVLGNCLLKTDLIDWGRVSLLTAIPKRCVAMVKSVLKANCCTDSTDFSEDCELNYIPIDKIKNSLMPR
jgi:acid phosphatase class B